VKLTAQELEIVEQERVRFFCYVDKIIKELRALESSNSPVERFHVAAELRMSLSAELSRVRHAAAWEVSRGLRGAERGAELLGCGPANIRRMVGAYLSVLRAHHDGNPPVLDSQTMAK
jgi:hypothetical protein